MPWARESLAGSLREKFPEAAVMETAQRWAGRGSEPGTQMGKGWEETSWETRGAKETQSHAACCTMALGLTQRHRRHPGVCILIQNLVFVTPSVELKYNKRRFPPAPWQQGWKAGSWERCMVSEESSLFLGGVGREHPISGPFLGLSPQGT